eukprot:131576-Chlamydomonas_euryale.AAC.6
MLPAARMRCGTVGQSAAELVNARSRISPATAAGSVPGSGGRGAWSVRMGSWLPCAHARRPCAAPMRGSHGLRRAWRRPCAGSMRRTPAAAATAGSGAYTLPALPLRRSLGVWDGGSPGRLKLASTPADAAWPARLEGGR